MGTSQYSAVGTDVGDGDGSGVNGAPVGADEGDVVVGEAVTGDGVGLAVLGDGVGAMLGASVLQHVPGHRAATSLSVAQKSRSPRQAVGSGSGEQEGEAVGLLLAGDRVGGRLGEALGIEEVGCAVGRAVGKRVGNRVGTGLGRSVGLAVGVWVGNRVGGLLGCDVDGARDGCDVVGLVVGAAVGVGMTPQQVDLHSSEVTWVAQSTFASQSSRTSASH